MARVSTKENKNIYQLTRESLKLTRESASELLETISRSVSRRSRTNDPCPIRTRYWPWRRNTGSPAFATTTVQTSAPSARVCAGDQGQRPFQIVLEMLASLNSVSKQKDRLIEITQTARSPEMSWRTFIFIQEELERISITVETLQLWSERMMATGVIDEEQYNAYKSAGLRRRPEFRVFFQRSGNRAPYFADAVIYSQADLSYNNCIIGNSK